MASRSQLASRPERVLGPLGVVAPPPIRIQTPTFDGTLATLFDVVRRQRIDLLEIPVFPICEAYYEYLVASSGANLDESAAALMALAYLVERKAFRLLPFEEAPEEAPLELVDPTVESYDDAIEALIGRRSERELLFFRTVEPSSLGYSIPTEYANLRAIDLSRALARLLERAEAVPETLHRERRSLNTEMANAMLRMGNEFRTLVEIAPVGTTRLDAIYLFLAILELMRLGRVIARPADDDVQFARA